MTRVWTRFIIKLTFQKPQYQEFTLYIYFNEKIVNPNKNLGNPNKKTKFLLKFPHREQ